jgi:Na+-driven multidrug efflux pump
MAFYSVSSMYLQNTGNYMKALLVSISRQGIFFIPLIIILPFFIGHTAIYVVQSVSDILSFIMALLIMKKHPVQDYA